MKLEILENQVNPSAEPSRHPLLFIHGAEFRLFDGCGHMMMLEAAWPSIAVAMKRWIQSLQTGVTSNA